MFDNMGQLYIAILISVACVTIFVTISKARKNNQNSTEQIIKLLMDSRIKTAEILNEAQKIKALDTQGTTKVEDYVVDELGKMVDKNDVLLPQEKELIKNNIRPVAKYLIKKDDKK